MKFFNINSLAWQIRIKAKKRKYLINNKPSWNSQQYKVFKSKIVLMLYIKQISTLMEKLNDKVNIQTHHWALFKSILNYMLVFLNNSNCVQQSFSQGLPSYSMCIKQSTIAHEFTVKNLTHIWKVCIFEPGTKLIYIA